MAGSEAHHARDVLRMRAGEKLVLFDGQGREITAEIVDLDGDEIRLRKLHEAETPPLRCRIVLGQAIPKGKNMELIVQKAVEIGAAEIAPIISDRTDCAGRFRKRRAETVEMAADRDRGGQAMRSELAAARAHAEKTWRNYFLQRRRNHSIFD